MTGTCRAGIEEATKMIVSERSLLRRQVERAGVVEHEEEKEVSRETLLWPVSTIRGLIKRRQRNFLHGQIVTRGNGVKLKEGSF